MAIQTKNRNFSMTGYSVDNEGDKWRVTFTLMRLKNSYRPYASAKCVTKRSRTYRAPKDANLILSLWPIEFWPEFAKPLAHANGNDGSIQEGLF